VTSCKRTVKAPSKQVTYAGADLSREHPGLVGTSKGQKKTKNTVLCMRHGAVKELREKGDEGAQGEKKESNAKSAAVGSRP